MVLKALIIEQLEEDGTIRSLRLLPGTSAGDMPVAFATEYQANRSGPFHFYDEDDERRFAEQFAKCRARKLGSDRFSRAADTFRVHLGWTGLPTEKGALSYYALSLPRHAIPLRLSIRDPHKVAHEYRRTVARDDEKGRYIVYVECSSAHGMFDFELACDFILDSANFASSSYSDPKTTEGYAHLGDDWKHWVGDQDRESVAAFLAGSRGSPPDHAREAQTVPQAMALPLHMLIVLVFGVLALGCICGGVYAIAANATTELDIFGAHLTTGNVGVAFVGLGLIIALFTVRAVLRNLSVLARLRPSTDRPSKNQDDLA